jgi:hypothetical protein
LPTSRAWAPLTSWFRYCASCYPSCLVFGRFSGCTDLLRLEILPMDVLTLSRISDRWTQYTQHPLCSAAAMVSRFLPSGLPTSDASPFLPIANISQKNHRGAEELYLYNRVTTAAPVTSKATHSLLRGVSWTKVATSLSSLQSSHVPIAITSIGGLSRWPVLDASSCKLFLFDLHPPSHCLLPLFQSGCLSMSSPLSVRLDQVLSVL